MEKNNEKLENPQAFPTDYELQDNHGSKYREPEYGMTLRDYFASKVMVSNQIGFDNKSIEEQAKLCYKMADAMLKERVNTLPNKGETN